MQYCGISATCNYNLQMPIQWLARKLMHDDQLDVEMTLFPSEGMRPEAIAMCAEEMEAAAMLLLSPGADSVLHHTVSIGT